MTSMPPPAIRVLVVCTSFGRTLAAEMGMSGLCTKALMTVGDGIPLVNYWLTAAKAVPRLLPLEQKVFILCNDDNRADFVQWANTPKLSGGFPQANILSNGASGNQRSGLFGDVDIFLQQTGGGPSDLVVIDGDYLFHPKFNLKRVVESAMVRGKDTLTWLHLEDAASQPEHSIVEFAGAITVNPKVARVLPYPAPGATASMAAWAPLLVLKKSTVPLLQDFLTTCGAVSPVDETAKVLAWLPSVVPVYAVNVSHCFGVKTAESYRYVDNLFAFFNRQEMRAGMEPMEDERKNVIKGTVSIQTEAGGELTQRTVAEAMIQTGMTLPPDLVLDPGAAELERVVAMFADRYENFATARAVKARDLPFRFKHADKWKHEAKIQHVVFTTTNHEYGYKRPRQEELATKFFGIKGGFTTEFPIIGGKPAMFADGSMVSGLTRSKVHPSLDDF